MFEFELFKEIFRTLWQNKLRTFLTGVSVGWGIFMLVILLGAGKGLANGFRDSFGSSASCIFMWAGQTGIPYMGLKPGRAIRLVLADCDEIKRRIEDAEYICPTNHLGDRMFSREKANASFPLRMVGSDFSKMNDLVIVSGRMINGIDDDEHRKTVIIGRKIAEQFFPAGSAVDEIINIDKIPFRIVGVYDESTRDDKNKNRSAIIPFSTGQKVFNTGGNVQNIRISLGNASTERSAEVLDRIKNIFSTKYKFSPKDGRAIWLRNNVEEYQNVMLVMRGINVFIWLIGACTIVAGAVGVSNIMMISVDERTMEIGVRKALGATPFSIIWMVILESLVITLGFGILGMAVGMGVLEIGSIHIPPGRFFKSPDADLVTALVAVGVLAFAGVAASVVPAGRAAGIRPIEALKEE